MHNEVFLWKIQHLGFVLKLLGTKQKEGRRGRSGKGGGCRSRKGRKEGEHGRKRRQMEGGKRKRERFGGEEGGWKVERGRERGYNWQNVGNF